MRLSKLMLSAIAAVFTLVGCSKDDHSPEDTHLKTVQLSLENVVMTKGAAGDKISAGDPVTVKNFKVFLTDESYSPGYSARNADGTGATFYFTSASDLSKVHQFHFVDHKCTKVVVVANAGDITFEQMRALTTPIANQQDQKNLILYGESNLSQTNNTHTDETGKYTYVYTASVSMVPTIARFEIDGFAVQFSSNSEYSTISVTDIAFQHYFPNLKVTTSGSLYMGGSGTHVKHIENLDNEAEVFGWFNDATSAWYIDSFNSPLAMTADEPKADAPNPLAYHFYAGNIVPTLVVKLLADGAPAYVYSEVFKKKDGSALTEIEPGVIYRMSVAGETATDGSILIPDDLDPIQRCLNITVEVVKWQVVLVTPQF